MTILLYVGLFVASVVVTLAGCHLFTNAIEWLGKRLNISEGAVGSVFAAVGTTLPETSIPIIAIFFGAGREQMEVGLGVHGAPICWLIGSVTVSGAGMRLTCISLVCFSCETLTPPLTFFTGFIISERIHLPPFTALSIL